MFSVLVWACGKGKSTAILSHTHSIATSVAMRDEDHTHIHTHTHTHRINRGNHYHTPPPPITKQLQQPTWLSKELGAQPATAHTALTSWDATETLRSWTTKNRGGPTRKEEDMSLHADVCVCVCVCVCLCVCVCVLVNVARLHLFYIFVCW